ncbi:hypothetical protein MKK63_24740 [Methylobacterium sp. J-088]|uniref:hypothetical protein n=1 Tax=Methylobacterium sp. J-088 TaxID=2836664 RepID=UPI001FB9927A|nr:hypothetical protein [Methylobacterium sp. J-088]MCJ2065889.1 hypothetical protein [Methylobacterium sp. J-088]
MATQAYRLTFLLRLAGSDTGTTRQTVTIATETKDEAVKLAQFYRSDMPDGSLCSATLTDADGQVLWSEQKSDAPHEATPQEDHP